MGNGSKKLVCTENSRLHKVSLLVFVCLNTTPDGKKFLRRMKLIKQPKQTNKKNPNENKGSFKIQNLPQTCRYNEHISLKQWFFWTVLTSACLCMNKQIVLAHFSSNQDLKIQPQWWEISAYSSMQE